MKSIRGGLVSIGLLAVAGAAQAGVTSTWTATNDYDFRGITQTANNAAIQGSLDYAHPSGWYAGAWASNLRFGATSPLKDPKVELDLYTGFTKTLDSGLSYDLGGIYYTYPEESDFNYLEGYAGLGFTAKSGASIKGKFFYSPDFGGKTTPGNTPAEYISADGSFPLPQNFSVIGHAGYSWGDYWDFAKLVKNGAFGRPYFDYSVGVGYTLGKFSLAAKWVDGSDNKEAKDFQFFSSKARVVVTVATTFPWGG
jgi:uncharacterized protein (TIGR02001 family)